MSYVDIGNIRPMYFKYGIPQIFIGRYKIMFTTWLKVYDLPSTCAHDMTSRVQPFKLSWLHACAHTLLLIFPISM